VPTPNLGGRHCFFVYQTMVQSIMNIRAKYRAKPFA